MGIIQYEELKLRQQEIEVKALVALMRFGRRQDRRFEAESRLCKVAFPETVVEEIKQETLTLSGNMIEIDISDDACEDCADLYGIDAGMPNCKCDACKNDL